MKKVMKLDVFIFAQALYKRPIMLTADSELIDNQLINTIFDNFSQLSPCSFTRIDLKQFIILSSILHQTTHTVPREHRS